MSEPDIIIRTVGLTKAFKNVQAVSDLSINVRKADIYGFLGPNGAGKTTTIKMVLGLTHPDSGEIYLGGKSTADDGVEARKSIGYMPERTQFFQNLTAMQTMEFFAELKGVDKDECEELLVKMGLEKWMDAKVGTFSKGMVQLMGIGQALLGSPMLLVLDEPTSGLDPRWARVLKDIMLEVNAKGTTVFFSSHLLSEVQELCNRVAILNNGGLVVENTMAAVSSGQAQKPKLVIRVSSDPEAAVGALKEKGFAEAYAHGNVITVHCDTKDKAGVLSALTSAKVTIEDFRTEEASLEDAFMKYIGAGGDAGGKLDAP